MHAEWMDVFLRTGAMDGEVAEYLRQENIPYFDMQAAMYSQMEGNLALLCMSMCLQLSTIILAENKLEHTT